MPTAGLRARGRTMARAGRQVAALVVGPMFLGWMVWLAVAGGGYLVDFQRAFLPASSAVLHGASPYPAVAQLPELVSPAHASIEVYVYPPLLALAGAPLALLPHAAATLVYSLVLVATLGGSLWLMGVRDPRCYTVLCLWPATYTVFQTGAVSALLACGIALAWRWRSHGARLGLLVAALVALKLFVWPLGLWLLATRRYRAAVWSALGFPALVLGTWAAIGFAGLRSYLHLLSVVGIAEAPRGYGAGGIAAASHLSQEAVMALGLLVVAGAFVCLMAARPAHLDRTALSLAVFAMLLLSPIVWLHYLMVLVVPTALASRRFSWYWVAPAVLQFATIASMHTVYPDGNPWALGLCWASIVLTTFLACRAEPRASLVAALRRTPRERGVAVAG